MSAARATHRLRSCVIAFAGAAVGLAISACGDSGRPPTARAVHLNGQAAGDYVSEISASGTSFLVPATDLADQGSHTFDVVATANANPADGASTGPASALSTSTTIVAEATTVVPRDAQVELLATGSPGKQFALRWTDTCGGTRIGRSGRLGGSGGSGQLVLRSPAVVKLTLPHSTGINTCYVATVAAGHAIGALHLSILDH